jgi:hypothetical protein
MQGTKYLHACGFQLPAVLRITQHWEKKMTINMTPAGKWNGDVHVSANSIGGLGSSLFNAVQRLYEAHMERAMMRLSPGSSNCGGVQVRAFSGRPIDCSPEWKRLP